ncbi:MAG: hypothetical protein QG590_1467, partial [Pseudomonadota bacterium]|nr:hypothetical protein [Pseudomonadota bacterium]
GAQAIQARNTADQVGCGMAEPRIDPLLSALIVGRNGKEQRGQTRICVELQADDDQRHTERMRPDTFATTQFVIAIHFTGEDHGIADECRLIRRKAFAKCQQGMFEVALGGDRMDNGNHGVIIQCGLVLH